MAEIVVSTNGIAEIAVCDCGAWFIAPAGLDALFRHEERHAKIDGVTTGLWTNIGWFQTPAIMPALHEKITIAGR